MTRGQQAKSRPFFHPSSVQKKRLHLVGMNTQVESPHLAWLRRIKIGWIASKLEANPSRQTITVRLPGLIFGARLNYPPQGDAVAPQKCKERIGACLRHESAVHF